VSLQRWAGRLVQPGADVRLSRVRWSVSCGREIRASGDSHTVPMDPHRFLPFVSRQVMQARASREEPPAAAAWAPVI